MSELKSLKDIVSVNNDFRNSINIYLNLNKRDKIAAYIPTSSSVAILKDYLSAIEANREQASILVGPYGKGKSHLLLVLLAILSMDRTDKENKRVIEGYSTPKGEDVEGLKANNLRYYKVDFKDRKQSHQSNRELAMNLKDLLCIKEDIYKEQKLFGALSLSGKEQMLRYFAENGRGMLMVYDTRVIPFITKEIEKMDLKEQPLKIYIFADGAYPYTDDFASVIDKVSLIPMPYAYHRAIKDVLPDQDVTKVDDTELTSEEQKEMMAEAIEAEKNEKTED